MCQIERHAVPEGRTPVRERVDTRPAVQVARKRSPIEIECIGGGAAENTGKVVRKDIAVENYGIRAADLPDVRKIGTGEPIGRRAPAML